MVIHLQKNARTTPAIRRELQTAEGFNKALAKCYNVTPPSIATWRAREDVSDASHCPRRLQTTLTSAQEAVAVELRRTALLPSMTCSRWSGSS